MKFKDVYYQYEKEILVLFLIVFSLGPYFLTGYLTVGSKTHLLDTAFDEKLPFIPFFILFYISSYLFIFLPFFLIKEKTYLRKVFWAYIMVLGLSYLVFLVFPVEMLRPVLGTGFFEKLAAWLYEIDGTANNCFPSIHVAIAFLAGMVCFGYKKKYSWLLAWMILIILSTLFVKQHYLWDVAGGLILGAFGYWWFFRER